MQQISCNVSDQGQESQTFYSPSIDYEMKASYRRPRFPGVGGAHDRIGDDSVILYLQLRNNTREELAWRLARDSRSEINLRSF